MDQKSILSHKRVLVEKPATINSQQMLEIKELAKKEKLEIFKISAVTGEGIKELLNKVSQELKELPKEDLVEVEKDKKNI